MVRDRNDTLALKIYMRIRDAFGYNPRGHRASGGYVVLNCSKMPSTITEASFINAGFFNSEADRFYNNTGNHRQVEANAIFKGWNSWCIGQGFGLVDYEYVGKSPSDSTRVTH